LTARFGDFVVVVLYAVPKEHHGRSVDKISPKMVRRRRRRDSIKLSPRLPDSKLYDRSVVNLRPIFEGRTANLSYSKLSGIYPMLRSSITLLGNVN
jgi:hypothetical protein